MASVHYPPGQNAQRAGSECIHLSAQWSALIPAPATLERWSARVEQNAHAKTIEEFYSAHASMQEKPCGAASCGGSRSCAAILWRIRWIFQFEWLDRMLTDMEALA